MESPAIRYYRFAFLTPAPQKTITLLSGLFWIDRTSKKESKTKLHNSDLVFFYVRELLHKKIAFINVITPLAPV